MKYEAFQRPSRRKAGHDPEPVPSAGPGGLAIRPPAYGVDFVDRATAGVADAVENRTGMPDRLKAGLELLSSRDLSGVRVRYNSAKPARLNACAYTQGRDIEVGPGQEKHLPHEAWHAVQQMQGRVEPTLQAQGVSINDDEGLEREADVMGARALRMRLTSASSTPPANLSGHGRTSDVITQLYKGPIQVPYSDELAAPVRDARCEHLAFSEKANYATMVHKGVPLIATSTGKDGYHAEINLILQALTLDRAKVDIKADGFLQTLQKHKANAAATTLYTERKPCTNNDQNVKVDGRGVKGCIDYLNDGLNKDTMVYYSFGYQDEKLLQEALRGLKTQCAELESATELMEIAETKEEIGEMTEEFGETAEEFERSRRLIEEIEIAEQLFEDMGSYEQLKKEMQMEN